MAGAFSITACRGSSPISSSPTATGAFHGSSASSCEPICSPSVSNAWRRDGSLLDDWGPDRLTAPQRRDLIEIVEDRHGAGSILVTSQLPVEAWHDVIDEPTFADAILDRLVHNAHRLELGGPSMRKTKA